MSSNDSLDGATGLNTSNTDSAAENPSSPSEIEDIMWTLLARSGLISQFKGEIAKCLQENSGNILSDSARIQSRADPAILQSIYEYLQWIGMKQTSAFLLSESSVSFDITTTEENAQPHLCHLFRRSGSPDASLAFDDEQFASPQATQRKSEPSSVNLDNRTYTAGPGPGPLQPDESREMSTLGSFLKSRQNASANFTRSSVYFTPDQGSPSKSKEDTCAAETTTDRRDDEKVDIVRLLQPEPEGETNSNAGNGDYHKMKEKLKTLTIVTKDLEEESMVSLRSMQSEPVDSPPAKTKAKSSGGESDMSISEGQDDAKDENENVGERYSKSPTFCSPSSSEQIDGSRGSKGERNGSQKSKSRTSESCKEKRSQNQQQQQRRAEAKEEDTLDESISDLLCSLPDNNTQDISLGGETSDADSKDLDSCDHVLKL